MFMFFLPPVVQALIGVVIIVVGVVLHLPLIAGVGAAGIAIGAVRWVRSRRRAIQR